MPRHLVLVGLAGLLACGDADEPELVPFAAVCGQSAPVRLLELAPGRQLESFTAPFMVAGRRYFRTSRNNFTPPGSPGDLDTEVWSTGPCGEDPRLLAKDVAWVSTQRDRWPGVVLACGIDSDAVIALDPAGGPPSPRVKVRGHPGIGALRFSSMMARIALARRGPPNCCCASARHLSTSSMIRRKPS